MGILVYFIRLREALVDVSSSLYYKYLNILYVSAQLAISGLQFGFTELIF
jgi:hypothetical protein